LFIIIVIIVYNMASSHDMLACYLSILPL